MKKILMLGALLTMLVSCNKKEEKLDNLQGKELSAEEFFTEVVNTNVKLENEDDVILFSYRYNAENQTIIMDSHKISKMSFAVAFDLAGSEKENLTKRAAQDTYKVSCDNGKKSWDKKCSGKWECGNLALECLKQGGCATVCNANMIYVPEFKTFYLSDDISHLIDEKAN